MICHAVLLKLYHFSSDGVISLLSDSIFVVVFLYQVVLLLKRYAFVSESYLPKPEVVQACCCHTSSVKLQMLPPLLSSYSLEHFQTSISP